jgi:hypothetical protein
VLEPRRQELDRPRRAAPAKQCAGNRMRSLPAQRE